MWKQLFIGVVILLPYFKGVSQCCDPKYDELVPVVESLMIKTKVPGLSIAIMENYKVVWSRGFGLKEAGSKDTVNEQTLFQTASISKVIVALAALRMVQDSHLLLDEDVNMKLSSWRVPVNEFTKAEKVTLRRLLSHTAGTSVPGFIGYDMDDTLPSTIEVLQGKKPANNPPVSVYVRPGQMYSYSGGGFSIVEQLISDLTGRSFHDVVKEKVFEPLHLELSTYEQSEAKLTNVALAHKKGQVLNGRYMRFSGYNGLWSTPTELANILCNMQQALRDASGKLLNKEFTELMLTPVKQQYGLGVMKEMKRWREFFGHGGHNIGYIAHAAASKEGGVGMVIMTNSNEGWKVINKIYSYVGRRFWGL